MTIAIEMTRDVTREDHPKSCADAQPSTRISMTRTEVSNTSAPTSASLRKRAVAADFEVSVGPRRSIVRVAAVVGLGLLSLSTACTTDLFDDPPSAVEAPDVQATEADDAAPDLQEMSASDAGDPPGNFIERDAQPSTLDLLEAGEPERQEASTPAMSRDAASSCMEETCRLDAGSLDAGISEAGPDELGPDESGADDGCPSDPNKTNPGLCGCGVPDADSDQDGAVDCDDACPSDPDKVTLGKCGCGMSDDDSDGDGTADCQDNCPDDPLKSSPGVCGCGVAETDEDEDSVPDCADECIGAPLDTSTQCGCGNEVNDSDEDGIADCADDCPSDPNKTEPGTCGCSMPDVDSDSDGTLDCNDECPMDPLKLDQGLCGCGVVELDTDGDLVPDCIDECPNDSSKIELGVCGCGYPDSVGSDMNPECLDLASALLHRYRFAGTGTTVVDSVGSAHGVTVGTTLDGSGSVDLDVGPYVDLPNHLISGLRNMTLEVWVELGSLTSPFQRILDFGDSGTEGESVLGRSYVFLTPRTTSDKGNAVRLTYFGGEDNTEVALTGPSALLPNARSHLACVFDDDGDMMYLYVNGTAVQQASWPHALERVNDINNWLGRSQFMADPGLDGSIEEFRIYDVALDAQHVEYSFDSGANPSFLE